MAYYGEYRAVLKPNGDGHAVSNFGAACFRSRCQALVRMTALGAERKLTLGLGRFRFCRTADLQPSDPTVRTGW